MPARAPKVQPFHLLPDDIAIGNAMTMPCVCMYVCICVYACVYKCVCVRVCVWVGGCIYVHVYMCVYNCGSVCVYKCGSVCVCAILQVLHFIDVVPVELDKDTNVHRSGWTCMKWRPLLKHP